MDVNEALDVVEGVGHRSIKNEEDIKEIKRDVENLKGACILSGASIILLNILFWLGRL